MTKLRAPIKPWLDDSLDEARIQRMWRGLSRPPSHTRRRGWIASGALALCALIAVLLVRRADAGPLAAVGGEALRLDRAQIALDDGSQIAVAPGAGLRLLANSGRDFGVELQRGRASFHVRPGGPRRWRIECGVASVTVVGTQFTIDRSARALRVEVAHGVVLVRGIGLAEARRLTAGQVLVLDGSSGRAIAGPDVLTVAAFAADAGVGSPLVAADSALPLVAADSTLPLVAAEQPPQTAEGSSVPVAVAMRGTAVLEEADRARRGGQRDRALALLQRLMREQPGTAEAAIAAFSLARMRMLDDPRAAAAALQTALGAGTPNGLREDVLARLVEAYARAGQQPLAAEAAQAYRSQFPHGRRLAEVEHWAIRP